MCSDRVSNRDELDLEALIDALEGIDLSELREAWQCHWGQAPTLRSPDLLRRLLSWRLQAEAYGGLSREVRARLYGKSMPRDPLPEPGALLTREYKGVLHQVEIGEGIVRYAGGTYRSLSQVARHITGVRWNGRRFFGLRSGTRP